MSNLSISRRKGRNLTGHNTKVPIPTENSK